MTRRVAMVALAVALLGERSGVPGSDRFLGVPLVWRSIRAGIAMVEVTLDAGGPLAQVRLIVARLDPAVVRFQLVESYQDQGMRGAWTVDSLPSDMVFGINAGQFRGGVPWGWLVREGVELQPPGQGSLAMRIGFDSSGTVEMIGAGGGTPAGIEEGFQSYPMLLADGHQPSEFRRDRRAIDLDHRDSRLAFGTTADGQVLVVLTRFIGLGETAETFPYGPTVPEMAALMNQLGAINAVLLDGGLSSQLVVRDSVGGIHRWGNWRPVPVALLASPVGEEIRVASVTAASGSPPRHPPHRRRW